MDWFQKAITLTPKSRGFHLVTTEIEAKVPEIQNYEVGLLHLFIHHTSASLSINENAGPTVRTDMESHFNELVPENASYYIHTCEGPGLSIQIADAFVHTAFPADAQDVSIEEARPFCCSVALKPSNLPH